MSWKDEMHAAMARYLNELKGTDAVWANFEYESYSPGCETCDHGATRDVSVKYVDSAGKTRYATVEGTMAELIEAIT